MTVVDATQDWLALEHEAVWLYPVIGARFGRLVDDATESYDAHRAVRDSLLVRLRAAGVTPVTTRLSYDIGPLDTRARARRAARDVEERIAAACLTLVTTGSGDTRAYALKGVTRAALAELAWGAAPRAFPGLAP